MDLNTPFRRALPDIQTLPQYSRNEGTSLVPLLKQPKRAWDRSKSAHRRRAMIRSAAVCRDQPVQRRDPLRRRALLVVTDRAGWCSVSALTLDRSPKTEAP